MRAAQSERVIVKAGSSPGTVKVVAKDGRDIPPLRVLSVITSDGTVHPVNKGADFTDANVWREIGGGEICYSGEPAIERTSVTIPENSDLPFDAPPGNWQISTVVLNTASGPHPVVRPEVGDTLSTGERIDNVVVCMDIFYSSAPSPRFLALDDHTADPDPVPESGDSSGGDEASTPAETSEPGESETTEETPARRRALLRSRSRPRRHPTFSPAATTNPSRPVTGNRHRMRTPRRRACHSRTPRRVIKQVQQQMSPRVLRSARAPTRRRSPRLGPTPN